MAVIRFLHAEKLAWLRLARTDTVGPFSLRSEAIESSEALWQPLTPCRSFLGGAAGAKPLTPPPAHIVEREFRALQKVGGRIVTAACPDYPPLLAACEDAPPVLSVPDPALMRRPCTALVGARNASINGRKLAEKLARDLGVAGQVIVSGLARGIDTAAHKGALESGTIAVVAGGIDVIYPEENAGLYEQIRERGCIVAESPLGQKPFAQSFPRRNRIVSGLSAATVIVEATMRSGSLITARLAGEQGREVLAVPGSPFDPRAAGPNALIRDGAVLIRGADDVLEALRGLSGHMLREPPAVAPFFTQEPVFTGEEAPANLHDTVVSHLSFTPITVDELLRACHVTIPVLQSVLLELELAGRIKRLPGNRVSLLEE
ncbi:MAG: DNA-processing protein DprA [Alphaproteobacteria bacterium]